MHMDESNLTNLTGLWKKYGSRPVNGGDLPLLHANTHWPHRCWIDWRTKETVYTMPSDTAWLEDMPESTVIPVWPMMSDNGDGGTTPFEWQPIEKQLLEKKWACAFEQTAMYREVQEKTTDLPLTRPGFQVIPVRTAEERKTWVAIASEAFAYRIDNLVIDKLINDKDIQILSAHQNGQAVASALLYKTGDIIGIHQVGVKHAFQGQGIARDFMHEIMSACALWQGKYIVLQASQAGQPLYERLGFKAQFTIKNYLRV